MKFRFSGLLEECQIYYVPLINVYVVLTPTWKVNLNKELPLLPVSSR